VTARALVLRDCAKQDVREAMLWYERARTGLGLDFANAIEGALARIEAEAESFPMVHGEVRRCLVGQPFRSYGIFFTVAPELHQGNRSSAHPLAIHYGGNPGGSPRSCASR
jgi:hypothetical protein